MTKLNGDGGADKSSVGGFVESQMRIIDDMELGAAVDKKSRGSNLSKAVVDEESMPISPYQQLTDQNLIALE